MNDEEEIHANIRSILGPLIGRKLLDITQHDNAEEEGSFIQLHFDDGSYLKFPIGEAGFQHNVEGEPTT